MTSKNKPAIQNIGNPEGIPVPKSLDVETANQIIRQNAEMDNEGRAKEAAGKNANKAQALVRQLGRTPKLGLDELVETDVVYRGEPIHTTATDNRSWVRVTGVTEGGMRAAFDAVSLIPVTDEYGNSYETIIHWAEVTKSELAENQEQIERDAADTAEIEKADDELRKLISKAITYQVLPHGNQWIGMRTPTLSEALALVDETGAEVELRQRAESSRFVVRATSETALLEAAAKLKNPPKFLPKRIRGFDAKVQLLIYLLDELKPLSTEWKKTGKVPMSEDDIKQPANRVESNGAFVH